MRSSLGREEGRPPSKRTTLSTSKTASEQIAPLPAARTTRKKAAAPANAAAPAQPYTRDSLVLDLTKGPATLRSALAAGAADGWVMDRQPFYGIFRAAFLARRRMRPKPKTPLSMLSALRVLAKHPAACAAEPGFPTLDPATAALVELLESEGIVDDPDEEDEDDGFFSDNEEEDDECLYALETGRWVYPNGCASEKHVRFHKDNGSSQMARAVHHGSIGHALVLLARGAPSSRPRALRSRTSDARATERHEP